MDSAEEILIHQTVARAGKITRRALALATGICERRIKTIVRVMHDNGVPIANTGDGYFITDNMEDMNHSANRLLSQAYDMIKHAAAMKRISFSEAHAQREMGYNYRVTPLQFNLFSRPARQSLSSNAPVWCHNPAAGSENGMRGILEKVTSPSILSR